MSTGSGVPPVERDAEKRCTASEREKPGRTHPCKQTTGHEGSHLCVCSRSWEASK